jgi:hypothetical protein
MTLTQNYVQIKPKAAKELYARHISRLTEHLQREKEDFDMHMNDRLAHLEAVEQSLKPPVTETALTLQREVTQQEDVDHML